MSVEIRDPSHAGSWYSSDEKELSSQLDSWLDAVKPPLISIAVPSKTAEPITTLPVPGARVLIAPHAGYSYSGPAAAWAYKSWDVKGIKRVFLLGPSHHAYLTKAALTKCDIYATPIGALTVDKATSEDLRKQSPSLFEYMTQSVDEAEHSLEMHLPYIYKILSLNHDSDDLPRLVPIMIGNTSPRTEISLGKILAPYLADPQNAFVISSDFAHWGQRFGYTYYIPDLTNDSHALESPSSTSSKHVDRADDTRRPAKIHESIKHVDFKCIHAAETGSHAAWTAVLSETKNTVCGRHPIAVVLAGIEAMQANDASVTDVTSATKHSLPDGSDDHEDDDGISSDAGGNIQKKGRRRREMPKGRFRFVRYERSSECTSARDSSVSYASAFAVL